MRHSVSMKVSQADCFVLKELANVIYSMLSRISILRSQILEECCAINPSLDLGLFSVFKTSADFLGHSFLLSSWACLYLQLS